MGRYAMRVYFQDGEGAVLGATFMQNHAYIIFSTRVLNTWYSASLRSHLACFVSTLRLLTARGFSGIGGFATADASSEETGFARKFA